ncbi:AMP-dependent synthetase [Methylocystis sp. JAN1]|uniref:AMP-dependent synthetase n=1 Tax=Methylocystis sp. JAN1 TaxID=3397211 RepID=UPI003FA21CE4
MTARAAFLEDDDAALARAHPLTLFGFDALIAGAARPRPGALAFRDDHDGPADEVAYADLYQRVGAALSRLRAFEFAPGERALICCPPGAQSFVALTAALAAGLDPVLAPPPLPYSRDAVAQAAKALKVSALFGPAQFCGLDFEAPLREIAAGAPSIRLIGALHGALDGAADFSPAALAARPAPRARLDDEWGADERRLIGALDDVGQVDFATQGALLGAALDLVRATRAAGEAPILSLCAPSSLSALVAGPLAALLAGCPLHFLAPFKAARFVETLDALGPTRLVAPSSVLADLGRAGFLTNGALVSVAALCNGAGAARLDAAPACPIVELRAAGGAVSLRATHAPAHSGRSAAARE